MSSHPFRYLCLREAGLLARLEQGIEQNSLVSLIPVNLSAHTRTAHQLLDQLVMCLHV